MRKEITGKNEKGVGGNIFISNYPTTSEEAEQMIEGSTSNGKVYLYDLALRRFDVDIQGKLRNAKLFEVGKEYTFEEVLEKLITNTRTPSVKAAIEAQESIVATANAVLTALSALPVELVKAQLKEQKAAIKSAERTLVELRIKQTDLRAIADAKKKAKEDRE